MVPISMIVRMVKLYGAYQPAYFMFQVNQTDVECEFVQRRLDNVVPQYRFCLKSGACVGALQQYTLLDAQQMSQSNALSKKASFRKANNDYLSEDEWWDMEWKVSAHETDNGLVMVCEHTTQLCICYNRSERLKWTNKELLVGRPISS